MVFSRGELISEGGDLLIDIPDFEYPPAVKNSIHLGSKLHPEDFSVRVSKDDVYTVNVIGVEESQAPTQHLKREMKAAGGEIAVDTKQDLAKVALVERHQGTGEVQVGFVHGFGFDRSCAIASTVAHDSHHMIVVGTDEADMALAANRLAEVGGGQIVVREGKIIALVELPIAGLMSVERA